MFRTRSIFGALALALLLVGAAAPRAVAQGTVPFQYINSQTADYAFLGTDCSKLVKFTSTGALAGTLGAAGTSFFAGCFIDVKNSGTAAVTITPTTSTIDGLTSLKLAPNAGVRILNDGANYFTQPLPVNRATPVGSGKSATLGNTLPGCLPASASPGAWLQFPASDGRTYLVPGYWASGC